jgi:hypothetical protein
MVANPAARWAKYPDPRGSAGGGTKPVHDPLPFETGRTMRHYRPRFLSKHFTRQISALAPLAGHLAAGLALAFVFVTALCSGDALIARLLREVGGLPVVLDLFLLHAILFACASFATAGGSADSGGGVAARPAMAIEARRLTPAALARTGVETTPD